MDLLSILIGIWIFSYILHRFLLSRYPTKYPQLLVSNGVYISFCFASKWFTRMNGLPQEICFGGRGSIVHLKRSLIDLWIRAGPYIFILLMVASVVALVANLLQIMFPNPQSTPIITPIIPGVNLPSHQVLYVIVVLAVNGIIHELGHAIAASYYSLPISRMGVFLAFIYPGAFVDVPSLQDANPIVRLRVACAGVMNNIAICGSFAMIWMAMPYLLFPYYIYGSPLVVSYVDKDFDVVRTLDPGHIVTSLNRVPISSKADWDAFFLEQHLMSDFTGFCSSVDPSELNAFGVPACCQPSADSVECFTFQVDLADKYVCRNPVSILNNTVLQRCTNEADCNSTKKTLCLQPQLPPGVRFIRLEFIDVEAKESKTSTESLYFVGYPSELYNNVLVSDYTPRNANDDSSYMQPFYIEKLCRYFVGLSLGLAVLNATPVYSLDGEHALKALCDIIVSNSQGWSGVSASQMSRISQRYCTAVLNFGSLLLLTNITLSLIMLAT
eukprot:TRINITY_DN3487_c0_g1_i1.p1 TRINITY_DN3487_c0_g1~~TRINITY_DN3487_c0_g1_i1.p1  ORF type:complete len:498 (-),score=95.96 TRINITY_DN3487_c0_g1_i1:118-1611(-)